MPVSASWQKRFLNHFAARPSLKKARVQKIFSLSQVNCSRARRKYRVQELRKACLELRSPEKSGGEGSFGLARCLDRAARAGEGGVTKGGDTGIGGGVTVDTGDLLQLSGQGRESGVDSMFQSVLSFCQLLEMVL